MKTIRDIALLGNVPVLVRTAMNVPIENGVVVNDYRLRRSLPTIKYLAERNARVILISHIGRAPTETLAPVAAALGQLLPNVSFFNETIGPRVRDRIRAMRPGEILVLENLRRDTREKENDPAFAKELAALADVFVQDSFDTCHRKHASIVGVPTLLPSYAGLVVEDEVRELTAALTPKSPSIAIIGGAKFATKEAVLTKLLSIYDHVFVGGALADDFIQSKGYEVGKSLVSEEGVAGIKKLLENPKLVLPSDGRMVSASVTDDLHAHMRVGSISEVHPDERILDAGPDTSAVLTAFIRDCKSVLWNGPLGMYENGFIEATDDLARAIAASRAHSVVGGGDTIASISNLGLMDHFSFVSTGGGAMLDFLTDGTLPGIDALS